MKTITLTQCKVALVDDADFEWLSQWKWHAHKSHNKWYAMRSSPRDKNGKKRMIRMHRQILKPAIGIEADHKDGNGLNNQRNNLRAATHAENQHNQRKRKGTSQFKGVYWNQWNAKWCALIKVGGKRIRLGYFVSEIKAAKAYDKAAKRYFGEFAHTNF